MLTVPRELGLPVKALLNFGTRANIEHGPLHFCLVKAIFFGPAEKFRRTKTTSSQAHE